MIDVKAFYPWFLMMALGACTQLPPPTSGRAGNQNSMRDSGGGGSGTFLSLDDSTPGMMRLTLSGEDAGKIYRFLSIAPESATDPTKVGRDFSCTRKDAGFACDFLIHLPQGNFKVQREESTIKKAAPEAAQVKESNAYLSISDPAEGGGIRLQVLDQYAEKIFQGLKTERTFDLMPDSLNGPGVRKAAEQVDCYQRSKAATPDLKTCDCHLFLNPDSGRMDPVNPSILQ